MVGTFLTEIKAAVLYYSTPQKRRIGADFDGGGGNSPAAKQESQLHS